VYFPKSTNCILSLINNNMILYERKACTYGSHTSVTLRLYASRTYLYSVALEMCSVSQISLMLCSLLSYRDLASAAFLASSAFGLPPNLPLARAAFSPALVRSRITSRSNSASAPKIWNTSLPPDVVVSMFSCKLLKPMPLALKPFISSMSCLRVRPSLSKRQTTKVSPARRWLADLQIKPEAMQEADYIHGTVLVCVQAELKTGQKEVQ
jgi:hypothetical protein